MAQSTWDGIRKKHQIIVILVMYLHLLELKGQPSEGVPLEKAP